MTRGITLAFLLLLTLVLLVYWQGLVHDVQAFQAAVVNVANNFTGRNAAGQFQNYPAGVPGGLPGGGGPGPGGPPNPGVCSKDSGSQVTLCSTPGLGLLPITCVYENPVGSGKYSVGTCNGGKCVDALATC